MEDGFMYDDPAQVVKALEQIGAKLAKSYRELIPPCRPTLTKFLVATDPLPKLTTQNLSSYDHTAKMPAPTALITRPEEIIEASEVPLPSDSMLYNL